MSSAARQAPTRAVPTIGNHSCDRACHDQPVPLAPDSLATLNPDMPTNARASLPCRPDCKREHPDEIYEKIYVAILELPPAPGTKLSRNGWPRSSTVSRARIRECWHAWPTSRSSSSTRSAAPTWPSDDRTGTHVFEARRLIEPAVVAPADRDADAGKARALGASTRNSSSTRGAATTSAQ